MKKIVLLILMIISVSIANADNDKKNYKCDGTTYSSTGRQKPASKPIATNYSWKDSKGNVYPIYISGNGSAYVIRTSSKTGKEYKQYLGTEISQDICSKLGIEYKGKK